MKITTFILFIIIVFALTVQAQPRIWNRANLEKAKMVSSEASKLIIRDADKALIITIKTVMDKEMIAPSGDKHDYISMGKYWWPNPKTADGLPYIRKDGVVNPEIEKLDRVPLGNMARSISNLSLAYYFTSDDKYAAKAVENLRIWFINKETRMNPNMNFGQTIPGRNNGKGRGEGIIDTYSFVEMLDGIELLKSSSKFTNNDRKALTDWFSTYLDWMLTSEIGKEEFAAKNNHGIAFDVQVVRYALFLGNEDIAKQYIKEFPARRLFTQIEPNGSQPLELARTTAMGYSLSNLTHILDMCKIAKTLKIDLYNAKSTDGRSITKAIDFLVPYLGKSVTDFPYKQIKDWDAKQKELCWILYRADSFTPNPVYKNLFSKNLNSSQQESNFILY